MFVFNCVADISNTHSDKQLLTLLLTYSGTGGSETWKEDELRKRGHSCQPTAYINFVLTKKTNCGFCQKNNPGLNCYRIGATTVNALKDVF